jgi:enoyl-CoA hydratase
MSYRTLLLEVADGVATLTLNRPEAMNAINAQMKEELARALDAVATDAAVHVLVITGAGTRAFCAGADLKERAGTDPSPAQFYFAQKQTQRLFSRIAQLDRPVIAAINGIALGGGCEIALACDLRIAAESATLGLTEVSLGVIPAGGGTQRLSRLVGAARAKELVFTAARLDAHRALALGLVNRVVPGSELAAAVAALAAAIAAQPPLAVRLAKQVIDKGQQTDTETAMEFELYAASILFDTEDRREGMRAFVDKRAPRFTGR